jgi:hypothetical protein
MTLKQNFRKAFGLPRITNYGCELMEKVADEFAIGFVEWFADNTLRVDLDGYKTFGDTYETKPHTIKELLEIYKKEKGL